MPFRLSYLPTAAVLLASACGGSSATSPTSFHEINDTFKEVNALFDASEIEDSLLSPGDVAAQGSVSYTGIAGIGTGRNDTGGMLGRLSLTVDFSADPTVTGTATGFVALDRARMNTSPEQFLADGTELTATTGELVFSGGQLIAFDGNGLLGMDVDGTLDVPAQAGLAIGTGSLTIRGITAAAVTEDALISDYGDVNATLDGAPVVVGMSVYAFAE